MSSHPQGMSPCQACGTEDLLPRDARHAPIIAGLFNTLYYTATFAFFWLAVAKVPRGLGLAATAQKFLTVMAAVWAGSQVRGLSKVRGTAGTLCHATLSWCGQLLSKACAGIEEVCCRLC